MSTPALFNSWPDIFAAGAGQAGGKGWNLARLARYGLPVAEAIVIPALQERQWRGAIEWLPQLEDAAAGFERDPGKLQYLRQRLLEQTLPQLLLTALADELKLRGWQQLPLAVRSSATAEDSGHHSFAGIHLTRLNVAGLEAVAAAVRDVWASLWTPAAVAYRQRSGLGHRDVAMAVVIMPLLPAQAGGIGFTCDPHSGRDDRVVIHAHWGLGESLVSGLASGDEIVLQEDPLDDSLGLVRYQPGSKAVMTVPVPITGGTTTKPTDAARLKQRVLDDSAAVKLGRLLRDAAIALDFVNPFYDIEWLWDGARYWLVQARPVTARARNTYRELRGQPDIWTRGNTCEVLPEPLSAMDWFNSRRLVNMLLEQGLKRTGVPILPGAQRAGLFHGRLYLNIALMQWENFSAFGITPSAFNALMGGHQPEVTVPKLAWWQRLQWARNIIRFLGASRRVRRGAEQSLEEIYRTATAWRSQPLGSDNLQWLQTLQDRSRYMRSREAIFFLQASSGAGIHHLVELIERKLPGDGHALAAALMAGGKASVTAQQAYDLADLARLAAEDPVARPWLENPKRDDDWRQLPGDNRFRRAFSDFLERYGHRAIYESYFRNPRWREAPGYLLDTLRGLMESDINAVRQQRQQGASAAKQRLNREFPVWLRPLLQKLTRSAILETNYREAARSALIAMLEPVRNTLLTIGADWRRRGALQQADDIFNLTPPEIYDALAGEIPLEALAWRAADRRRLLAEWMMLPAPEVMIETAGQQQRLDTDNAAWDPSLQQFKGVAVGSGRHTGVARLLRTPAEGARLNDGDILVAPSTDPAWTPLFLKAGGLVMETGGYLSHGAIVAREFGIPAVVNLPGILEQIVEGELLEVDGGQGVVRRLGSKERSLEAAASSPPSMAESSL